GAAFQAATHLDRLSFRLAAKLRQDVEELMLYVMCVEGCVARGWCDRISQGAELVGKRGASGSREIFRLGWRPRLCVLAGDALESEKMIEGPVLHHQHEEMFDERGVEFGPGRVVRPADRPGWL